MSTQTVAGSWFGGPNDSGGPTTYGDSRIQGIAVPNTATKGGYWMVVWPNGRTTLERQTDYGPAGWTGKGVDIGASALSHGGYTEKNFPTGANFKITYLGKNKSKAASAFLTGGGTAAGILGDAAGTAGDLTAGATGAGLNAGQAVGDTVKQFAGLAIALFDPRTWVRIGAAIVGILTLIFALHMLTKSITGVDVAKSGKRTAEGIAAIAATKGAAA